MNVQLRNRVILTRPVHSNTAVQVQGIPLDGSPATALGLAMSVSSAYLAAVLNGGAVGAAYSLAVSALGGQSGLVLNSLCLGQLVELRALGEELLGVNYEILSELRVMRGVERG